MLNCGKMKENIIFSILIATYIYHYDYDVSKTLKLLYSWKNFHWNN